MGAEQEERQQNNVHGCGRKMRFFVVDSSRLVVVDRSVQMESSRCNVESAACLPIPTSPVDVAFVFALDARIGSSLSSPSPVSSNVIRQRRDMTDSAACYRTLVTVSNLNIPSPLG